jgi:hypothetical protein
MMHGQQNIKFIQIYCAPNTQNEASSSSIYGAGGNPAYRTSAFEAVFTLTTVLVPPFISRGAPRQTA